MNLIRGEATEILLIIILEQRYIVIQDALIFLFENLPEGAVDFIALGIITLVMSDLVNEEQ